MIARFVYDGTETEAGDLASSFINDVGSGLRCVGVEGDELAEDRLVQEFGADLAALGWADGGRSRGPSVGDATLAAVFFVSSAGGQWLVGKAADRIQSAITPALRRLVARLKPGGGGGPIASRLRVTTDVWIADGSRRVTVSVALPASDDRPIDELVAATLERALTEVSVGEHIVEEL